MQGQEFERYAALGYNRIPVERELVADLETALSIYVKLANGRHSYLLESVQGRSESWGRYSIIGLPCDEVIKVRGRRVQVESGGRLIEDVDVADPLVWLQDHARRFRVAPSATGVPFVGGLVGYFGFETVTYIEPHMPQARQADPLGAPDILLMVSQEVVVFDNLRGKLSLVVLADPSVPGAYEAAMARLDRLEQDCRRPMRPPLTPVSTRRTAAGPASGQVTCWFERPDFEAAVRRIQRYILEGDVMQVVLSQRMSLPIDVPPLEVYRALRGLNPSPHMFYMDLGECQVIGSSPEILVRLREDEVTVRPIAGTRRRGRTAAEDEALEQELLADPKERAEHVMLIDLGRNDVGRISQTASVQLTERMVVERYSHVMHMVSNVTGRLKPGMQAMDVLRATFPAGTVSGAPKVRALEIIREIEPVKRGIYAGAVGYLSWSGTLDTAIAIRTAVVKEGVLHIQAGAGIVADSVPELEWEETMNKAGAMLKAVVLAEEGVLRAAA
ncbi:MAG: anthranilate synthase component I [Aquabacterium sp.]